MPDSFPTYGAGDIRSFVLPTVILGLLSLSSIIIWIRRYMIDQQSADYVKFAKAKGLNSREIARKHIFKMRQSQLRTKSQQVLSAPSLGQRLRKPSLLLLDG